MSRRRSRRFAVAVALLALLAGAGSAYAAWSATTSPPAATFSGAPDWTPPAVGGAAIKKNSTGYSAGYVKPGGQYYVYAQVAADTGNPASGLAGVAANLANLTSAQSAAALSTGTYSVEGATYNYRAGPFTVGAGVAAGSQGYTVTARDAANNALPSSQSVTVDGTAPTGSDVQTVATGGTAGKAEAGEKLVLTFSEPIDPSSLIASWDGSSRNVTFRIVNGSGSAADTVQIFNGATQLTGLGTITLPDKSYVKSTVDFTGSPMVLSGSTLTVTLGSTASGTNVTTGGAGATRWVPATMPYDRAGNALSSTTMTESGTSDAEF